jgi:hypothetical protein
VYLRVGADFGLVVVATGGFVAPRAGDLGASLVLRAAAF